MKQTDIFLIHSQHDTALPNFFDKAAGKANIRLWEAEWYTMEGPAWFSLREGIKESKAVFVLKGPNITASLYTSNWVSWEIGVAARMEKDVWVFESLLYPVFMPIAYLTDYVVYDPNDSSHLAFVANLLQSYGQGEPVPQGITTTCPFCSIQYNLHTALNSWNCPSCQRSVTWAQPVSISAEVIPQGGPREFAIAYPGVSQV